MVTKSTKSNYQLKKCPIFLVIEGGHGTGKTTLANGLKHRLNEGGYSVIISKEPFSLEILRLIKKFSKISHIDPYVLQYLILADRTIHNEFIKNALKKYDFVVSVRYIPSNIVYQRISGIPPVEINDLNSKFLKPDIFIMLKTNFAVRYKRIRKSPKVRKQHYFFLKEKLQLEQKYYLELYNSLKKKQTVCIIDTEKSKIEVANTAYRFIQTRLKKVRK